MPCIRPLFRLFFIFPLLLRAEMNLDQFDKKTCLEALQTAELPELWDHYLKRQTDLYFGQEANWLAQKECWVKARHVLELGSGNGTYLHQLSETFKDKTFLGLEKNSAYVKQASAQFTRTGLAFIEGNAEIEYEQLNDQFDAVFLQVHVAASQQSKTFP